MKPRPSKRGFFIAADQPQRHIVTYGKMHMDITTSGNSGPAGRTRIKPTIFIDGEAGTTGIEIRDRLAKVAGVEVLAHCPREAQGPCGTQGADVARPTSWFSACPTRPRRKPSRLPTNSAPMLHGSSTPPRRTGLSAGWTYGWPEMDAAQPDAIAKARLVSNPGCYPTGAIALIRPLVEAGLMPADYPVTVNAVSGYSGGGKSMIEAYQSGNGAGLRALRSRPRAQACSRAAEIRAS